MPIFNAESPNLLQDGPLIEVTVSLVQAANDALLAAGVPIPDAVRATALIDTGASVSVAKRGLLTPLGLHPVGSTQVNTPTDSNVACPLYAVQLNLPHGFLPTVTIIETELAGQNIEMLIGRDVLAHGVLIYQGKTGQFTLAF